MFPTSTGFREPKPTRTETDQDRNRPGPKSTRANKILKILEVSDRTIPNQNYFGNFGPILYSGRSATDLSVDTGWQSMDPLFHTISDLWFRFITNCIIWSNLYLFIIWYYLLIYILNLQKIRIFKIVDFIFDISRISLWDKNHDRRVEKKLKNIFL